MNGPTIGDPTTLKTGDTLYADGKPGTLVKINWHKYEEGEGMSPDDAVDSYVIKLDDGTEKEFSSDQVSRGPPVRRSVSSHGPPGGRKRKTRRGKKGARRHHRKTRAHRRR